MFTLTLKTDNVAFEGENVGEVQRILYEAIKQLDRGKYESSLLDYNGNNVGAYKLIFE